MPDESCSCVAKLVAICLVVTVCTTGCTSMRPVRGVNAPAPPQGFVDIKAGDRVAVEMKDGRQERFRVQSIDGDVLVSPSGQRYARTEMLQLRRQQLNHAITWGLVAGGVFVGVMLIGLITYYN